MAVKVIMPKQGLQMTEGTITKWIVKQGGECKIGEPLFEMETDKITIEIESPATGRLLKIVRGEGETAPITELIAVIGEPGEDISGILNAEEVIPKTHKPSEKLSVVGEIVSEKSFEKKSKKIFITPRAKMISLEKGMNYETVTGTGPEGLITERDVLAFTQSKLKATPLAKKIAADNDINISKVVGSGTRGKITKKDVEAVIAARKGGTRERTERVIPFKGMRKVIAERMLESLHTTAQATHRMKVDMSEAVRVHEAFNKAGNKISYTDIIIYTTCRALKEYQELNSELKGKEIVLKSYVNIGIAVMVENGLIVPVIKDADLMTLEEISLTARELIEKAREGKLKPEEYQGGSFTISNLGMFGLDSFTAIINPPESGILAIGKIEKAPVVEGDEIKIKPIMVMTLTYDHRVVYGALAAQFLARLKHYLENLYLLL